MIQSNHNLVNIENAILVGSEISMKGNPNCDINNLDNILESAIIGYINKHISKDDLLYLLKTKYHVDGDVVKSIDRQLKEKRIPSLKTVPLISVIIPTYNRKPMLKNCLDSIFAQRYNNIEVIIIDDCSNDGTHDLIQDYREKNIIYMRNDVHRNPGYNRRMGFNASSGYFIIFVDDDDFYLDQNYFSKAVQIHLQNKNLAFVCANTLVIDTLLDTLSIHKANISGIIDAKEYLMNFKGAIPKPDSTFTTVFMRDVLEKADFKSMRMMDDSAIYMRALLFGEKVFYCEDIVGVYRIHGDNLTKKLQCGFVIQNLEEKKWIYEKMKSSDMNFDIREWVLRQCMSTVGYYIKKSKPSPFAVLNLLVWSLKNDSELKYELFRRILRLYIWSKRSQS